MDKDPYKEEKFAVTAGVVLLFGVCLGAILHEATRRDRQ